MTHPRRYDTLQAHAAELIAQAGGVAPGEAVESLLERMSVETKNGAIVRGVGK